MNPTGTWPAYTIEIPLRVTPEVKSDMGGIKDVLEGTGLNVTAIPNPQSLLSRRSGTES